MKVVGASSQVLAEHDPVVIEVPVQFPSDPTYNEHVNIVPVYDEHNPKLEVHPYPVVKHPAKKLTQSESLFILVGASVQTKALQTVELMVSAKQGPSIPMRPTHP